MKKKVNKFKEEKLFVVGVIGPIASGKDYVSEYLSKRYGFKKISTGDFVRREAVNRKIKVSRNSLRKLQIEMRREYGEEVLVNKAIEEIKNHDYKKIALDGLRTPADVETAKKRLDAKIILVEVDPFLRFTRQKKRARHGYSKTYPQFLHEDAIENAMFDLYKTFKLADYRLDNNGSVAEMKRNINKLMKKIIREHKKL